MSEPRSDQLPDADPAAIARAIVLRKLAASAKTRAELAKALEQRKVPIEVATTVLDRFTEVGLIDDNLYAHTFARGRHEYKGLSARAISYQLAAKGVAKPEIENAVADLSAEVQLETAIKFAAKKVRSISNLDEKKQLERVVGFLARKGYSASVCYEAAKIVLNHNLESDSDLVD